MNSRLHVSNGGEKQMLIANPIYDVVFKYLLDDNKIAKKLLSLLIGKEIITLEYKPSEVRNDLDARQITLLHLDFSALVRLEDGTQQHIIIELQKAKLAADIVRFRRYLASQYSDVNNTYNDNGEKKAIPIFSIYFLGHYLEHTKVPVIRVNRTYYDAATGEEIKTREPFIEGLTHDSMIIQIPALKTHRRNMLERVLSVFQPSNGDKQFIDISEDEYPEEYREIFRRLVMAGAEEKVRTAMVLEDSIIAELDDRARKIAETKQELGKTKQELGKTKQELEETKRALEGKDRVIDQTKRAMEDKEKMIQTAVKVLADSMNISEEEAEAILNSTSYNK
jgi:hypothetical protein